MPDRSFNNTSHQARTALFVVDVQNGFVSDKTAHVVERIQALLQTHSFDLTLFTRFINHPDSPYVHYLNWHRLSDPTETAIAQALEPFAQIVYEKSVYTSLTPPVLQLLRDKQISAACICGIDTDCCVLQTAVDLFEQNIHPYVLLDYCASNGGPESHEAAIRVLSRSIGAANLLKGEIDFAKLAS